MTSIFDMRSGLRIAAAALALVLAPALSQAQEIHHGDIEPYVSGGQLGVDPHNEVPVDASTGFKIYEGDFGDLAGGLWSTDDPGFNNAEGGFVPGSLLGMSGIGTLSFWNGTSWSAAGPGVQLTFEDALGELTTFTNSGVVNGTGIIGQFDGSGNLHEHLDFSITNGAAVGAYSIVLQLFSMTSPTDSTPLYAASTPFSLIFNRGLSSELFEESVEARVAPVPLPAAAWLLLSGLLGMGTICRRRGAATAAAAA